MRRLVAIGLLPLLVASLLLFGIADTAALIGDASGPESVATSSPSQANDSNSSANATITITMRTPPLPDE